MHAPSTCLEPVGRDACLGAILSQLSTCAPVVLAEATSNSRLANAERNPSHAPDLILILEWHIRHSHISHPSTFILFRETVRQLHCRSLGLQSGGQGNTVWPRPNVVTPPVTPSVSVYKAVDEAVPCSVTMAPGWEQPRGAGTARAWQSCRVALRSAHASPERCNRCRFEATIAFQCPSRSSYCLR